MASFKEITEAIKENPKVKKIVGNKYVKKLAIPVTTTAVSSGFALRRINLQKEQHKEQMREYKELQDRLEKLQDSIDNIEEKDPNVDKDSRKTKLRFKRKKFSIEGGGYKKESPLSIMTRGVIHVAENSKYQTTRPFISSQDIKDSVRKFDKDNSCTFNLPPENSLCTMSVCQRGNVLALFFKYLIPSDSKKLNEILDKYCKTFRNTDYSSVVSEGRGYVELWIAEDSLDYLVRQFIDNGLSLNIID